MRALLLFGLLLLTACSSLPDSRPTAIREAEQTLFQGVDAFEENDFHGAGEYFARALAAYRSIDDSEGQLIAHLNLLETALITRRIEFAEKQLQAAQTVHDRGETAPNYQGRITLLRARLAAMQGNEDAALEHLQALLPRFNEEQRPAVQVGTVQRGAVSLRTQLAFTRGSDEARDLWLTRLEACTDPGEPLQQARLLRFQAQSEAIAQPATAEAKLRAALTTYRKLAHRPEISETLHEMAELRSFQGDEVGAEALRARANLVEAHFRLPVDRAHKDGKRSTGDTETGP